MIKKIKIIVVLIFILLTVMLISSITNRTQNKYTVNRSTQTVIKQVSSLNRLETASYTIEKVIDVGTTGNKFSQFLYGDRILLIAHGQVIAGLDMSKVKNSDVSIDGATLNLRLPAPEILVNKLDNDQTRVYDRDQGLLTKGDRDLESEARKEAEMVIKDAACRGGILTEAAKNARSQLTTLFKGLGFTTVIIEIPEAKC